MRSRNNFIGRKGTINNPIFVNERFWNIDTAFGVTPMECLLPKYLYYFCCFYNFKTLDKSTTIPSLTKRDLLTIKMPVPPLFVQEKITICIEELFSELDKAVGTLQAIKKKLCVYRQAVLNYAFEGKYTPLVKMRSVSISDIVNDTDGLRRGPFGSSIKKSFFVSNGYKVYEQGNAIKDNPNIGTYYISEDKYEDLVAFRVFPNDFIVSCAGTIGKISQIPENAKTGIINQALLRIRLKDNFIFHKYFLLQFRSQRFQNQIISRGSGMKNLAGLHDFKNATMLIPIDLTSQDQIIAEVESRLSICDSIEQVVDTTLHQSDALRQSILKEAFEGRLV